MEILLPMCLLISGKVGSHLMYALPMNSHLSVCPSIWLIELDKLDTRLAIKEAREAFLSYNLTTYPPTTTIGSC